MYDIIKLLPESLANQIAAGEVVQRPASVVKELLENAVDAGATDIILNIKEAGKSHIQVIDNGKGMSETDARMSFERHATSKIANTADLFNITTMGFRGEALASIAAVAQVELKTKTDVEELATFIQIEGSQLKTHSLVSSPKGTSMTVKNLFYNVPARRNFLKSNSIEFNHINDEFVRISLANPAIAFSFYHNSEEVFILKGGKLLSRIFAILGNQLKTGLAPCREETPLMQVQGFIGKPETARKKRGDQYFFVNNRYIKSPYLHYAVNDAYHALIPSDHHPLYVLFIYIDPIHIDINVHPTKTEIKFDDEKTVFGIINSAVRKSISNFNLGASLDFSESVNNNIFTHLKPADNSFGNEINERLKSNFNQPTTQRFSSKANQEHWESLYDGLKSESQNRPTDDEALLNLRFESAASDHIIQDVGLRSNVAEESVVFQIHNSYIIKQVRSGMLIIDQQAAHERVLYDKFRATLDKNFGASQQFLFPYTLELSASDFALVSELETEIHALGFSFGVFGKNTIVINGIPADIKAGSEQALFEGFLDQFKQYKTELKLPVNENLARSIAKRSAIQKGIKLSQEEMLALVEQLLSSTQPSFAPDGKATIVSFDLNKLAGLF
ncbi:MAG: DNA mismatch repair endonuclease MutL [Cytophagales bacterium]